MMKTHSEPLRITILVDIALRIIQRLLNAHVLCHMASIDVASTICQGTICQTRNPKWWTLNENFQTHMASHDLKSDV
jgi:hypothetical protein